MQGYSDGSMWLRVGRWCILFRYDISPVKVCRITKLEGRSEIFMDDFEEMLDELLTDPEFKAEWDALQPERAIAQAIIDARKRNGMTRQSFSEMTGISQGYISKLERGTANPSIRTLQRLAAGMGMKLMIEFVPIQQKAI